MIFKRPPSYAAFMSARRAAEDALIRVLIDLANDGVAYSELQAADFVSHDGMIEGLIFIDLLMNRWPFSGVPIAKRAKAIRHFWATGLSSDDYDKAQLIKAEAEIPAREAMERAIKKIERRSRAIDKAVLKAMALQQFANGLILDTQGEFRAPPASQ